MAPPVLKSVEYLAQGRPARRRRLSRSAAAQGRRLAASSPGWSANRSGSNRPASRPTASSWPSAGGSPGRFGELQIWDVEKREMKLSLMIGYDTLLRRKLVAQRQDGRRRLPGQHDCGPSIPKPASKCCSAAPTTTGCSTRRSRVNSDHLITVSRDMSMKLIEVKTERFIDNITSITPGALKGGLICHRPPSDEGRAALRRLRRRSRRSSRWCGPRPARSATTPTCSASSPRMPGRVFGVAYNHDGSQIAAGSSSDGVGEVRVYNADGRRGRVEGRNPRRRHFHGRFQPRRQHRRRRRLRRRRAAATTPPTAR